MTVLCVVDRHEMAYSLYPYTVHRWAAVRPKYGATKEGYNWEGAKVLRLTDVAKLLGVAGVIADAERLDWYAAYVELGWG